MYTFRQKNPEIPVHSTMDLHSDSEGQESAQDEGFPIAATKKCCSQCKILGKELIKQTNKKQRLKLLEELQATRKEHQRVAYQKQTPTPVYGMYKL